MHSLPPDSKLLSRFEDLCRTFPPDCISELRKGVTAAMHRLSEMEDSFIGPNLQMAQQVADRILFLIDRHREFPAEKHPLIVGAIRYFIIECDCVPDSKPITGFDDDARIINHTLEQLGVADRFIEIPA